MIVKGGSKRRNRKVSSVAGVEYQNEASNEVNGVVRCQSIGSGSTMKRGSDPNEGGYPTRNERKKGKMRLKKSRSMGYLHGPSLLRYDNDSENNYKSGAIHLVEMAMTKLVITHKLEEKMLKTPLVGNLSNLEK
ncbi:hypothetical protein Lal_00020611 [Lupinus albus]|nr:hypothetical protein Lal_00020611 [Lupinus albus]